jgi:hypothetical protein
MKFLVSIYRPDGYDPAVMEDEAMIRGIDALNDEMVAAGVRVFVGGLHPASGAISIKPLPEGSVRIADGPYLKTAEQVGGFWVLEVAGIRDAHAWGRKAALACRAPVEVRQFH